MKLTLIWLVVAVLLARIEPCDGALVLDNSTIPAAFIATWSEYFGPPTSNYSITAPLVGLNANDDVAAFCALSEADKRAHVEGKIVVDLSENDPFTGSKHHCGLRRFDDAEAYVMWTRLGAKAVLWIAKHSTEPSIMRNAHYGADLHRDGALLFLVARESTATHAIVSQLNILSTHAGGPPLVATVSPDPNPWDALFNGAAYRLVFQFIFPSAFLGCSAAATFFSFQRYRAAKDNKKVIWWQEVPSIVLMVEACATLTLAVMLYVDGWWSAAVMTTREKLFFTTLLSGVSFGTTILVAIFWSDMLERVSKSSSGKNNFFQRHKAPLMGVVAFSCLIDPVTTMLYAYGLFPYVEILAGAYFSAGQFFTGAYLLKTATSFLRNTIKITSMGAGSSATNKKDSGGGSVHRFVRRMSRWLAFSAFFMFMFVTGAPLAMTFWIWTPTGWTFSWTVIIFARWGVSFGQVMACAPVQKKKKQKKETANKTFSTTNGSSAGSSVSSRSNSVTDSSLGGSRRGSTASGLSTSGKNFGSSMADSRTSAAGSTGGESRTTGSSGGSSRESRRASVGGSRSGVAGTTTATFSRA